MDRSGSSAITYSLLRLLRWLSVSSNLMLAADNFGRSSLIFSFTILPPADCFKANNNSRRFRVRACAVLV